MNSSPLASGWWTSEFGTAVKNTVASISALIATLYLIRPEMGLSPEMRITAVGALMAYIGGTSAVDLVSIHRRGKLKEKALENPEGMRMAIDENAVAGSSSGFLSTIDKKVDSLKPGEELTFVRNGVTVCLSRQSS